MASRSQTEIRTRSAENEHEVQRRIERVVAELEEARCQMHRAQETVRAAEECLMAWRLEWEAAALHVAELADLLESLQQHQPIELSSAQRDVASTFPPRHEGM